MKKALLILLFYWAITTIVDAQQQNNTVIIQNNTTPVVIEKPVYIEKYRTIYVNKPQPKRVAKKLAQPIQLLGYLWVYPEDLGNFKRQPLSIIESVNKQRLHGRDNWRIPTSDELAVLESNADKVGLGDDIYLATDHSNGVLRLVSTDESKKEKSVRLGEGILINGTVWALKNIGAANSNAQGREFTFSEAQYACPKGWRLPTKEEFNNLINSGKAGFGVNNNELFLPYTKYSDGRGYGASSYVQYWTNSSQDSKYAFILYFYRFGSSGGYGNPYSSYADGPMIESIKVNADGVCVRCVLD